MKGSLHNIVAFNSNNVNFILNFNIDCPLAPHYMIQILNGFCFHLCEICYYLGLKTLFKKIAHVMFTKLQSIKQAPS
jgi:hypothetical protein